MKENKFEKVCLSGYPKTYWVQENEQSKNMAKTVYNCYYHEADFYANITKM